MAQSNIQLPEHRIVGTRNSGNTSGSFPCPRGTAGVNVTFIVLGWDEIYAVYCEPQNNFIRWKKIVTIDSVSRNMQFTVANGIISWTSDSALYAPPIILY